MDKRDIFVTGNDNVVRPVTVTYDELASSFCDCWRISRADARRIAGQPMRTGYDQRITISGHWYWITHARYLTLNGKRREMRYHLQHHADKADCLKRS